MLTTISKIFQNIGWTIVAILSGCGMYQVYEWGFEQFVKTVLWVMACVVAVMALLAYIKYRHEPEPPQIFPDPESREEWQEEDTEHGRFWYRKKEKK